jgi:hypothetical protein
VLRDAIWQFVGAILGAFAIAASIVIAVLQRRRKRLSYEVVTQLPLLTVQEEIQGRVRLYFDNQALDDVTLIAVRLINDGNLPLRSLDFETPLVIHFNDAAHVLSSEIIEQRPTDLPVDLDSDGTSVSIAPLLLNPRDYVKLKCLVTGFERVAISGRIAGVASIRLARSSLRVAYILTTLLGLLLIGVSAFVTPGFWKRPEMTPTEVVSGILSDSGVMLLFAGLATAILERQKWIKFRFDRPDR